MRCRPIGEAQAIALKMSAKEPNDPSWQSTRAIIDTNMGAALMDQGNHDDGVAAYRDGLVAAKALVARDPRSVEAQTSLVIALYNLADAGEDAEANFGQAKTLLQQLDAAGVLPPDKRMLIGQSRRRIGKARGR